MGSKPVAAKSTAVTTPPASGDDAIPPYAITAVPVPGAPTSGGFGFPHALVIIACIATAAILAPHHMSIRDVLLLISGAGGIGAVVVVTVMSGGRGVGGRISRFLRAYASSGS